MARAAVLAPWFRSYRICIAHHQGPNAHAAPCAMCQQLHTLHTLADETQARPRRSSSPGHQAAAAMPDREPRSARDRPPTHHSLARRCESIATTRLAVPLLPCAHPHTLTQSHTHTITHTLYTFIHHTYFIRCTATGIHTYRLADPAAGSVSCQIPSTLYNPSYDLCRSAAVQPHSPPGSSDGSSESAVRPT